MRVVVQIVSGPKSGTTIPVPEGGVVRFGRTNRADFALPEDTFLSSLHFAVECRGGRAIISDLGSTNGTLVNDRRIKQVPVDEKDRITAGHTTFQVLYSEGEKPAMAAVHATGAPAPAAEEETAHRSPLSPQEKALVDYLGKQKDPVYAVMDAARDPFVQPVVQAFAEEWLCLYEGRSAEKLADCAPYLAGVKPNSRLAEELSHGWGKGWGVYLTCAQPLPDVRRHLRRFLMVESEEGKPLLFRYYDPKVLHAFLPTCTVDEARQFFGPVDSFLMESGSPESLVRFRLGGKGAEPELVALAKRP